LDDTKSLVLDKGESWSAKGFFLFAFPHFALFLDWIEPRPLHEGAYVDFYVFVYGSNYHQVLDKGSLLVT